MLHWNYCQGNRRSKTKTVAVETGLNTQGIMRQRAAGDAGDGEGWWAAGFQSKRRDPFCVGDRWGSAGTAWYRQHIQAQFRLIIH